MPEMLGPFIGYVDAQAAKIWLHYECSAGASSKVIVRVKDDNGVYRQGLLSLTADNLHTDCVRIEGLQPDTAYKYSLHELINGEERDLDLQGLAQDDLEFRTFPTGGFKDVLDFLLMSCHNPYSTSRDLSYGFNIWSHLPAIINENKNVRFAILAGDQIYADEIESQILGEKDPLKRQQLYLSVYRKFWSHISYRKIMCRIPSMLMWDDHDITDGWGSREDSFRDSKSAIFDERWKSLFNTAHDLFGHMQASRNPGTRIKASGPYDVYFRIGAAGFVMPDLRTNRNVREHRILSEDQFQQLEMWLKSNPDLDVLFFTSSVVFSHATPEIEEGALKWWPLVLAVARNLASVPIISSGVKWFLNTVGDLRDDINDSWGAKVNAPQTERILKLLFDWQNQSGRSGAVVILSGDIHTPGYATLLSASHDRAVIPHITATPVSYEPFSWIGEAVYREMTKVVNLGNSGTYTSLVSHHFCRRNVVVLSLRYFGIDKQETQLKVKYYLEGYPEPQIMLFDLKRGSHQENITWDNDETVDSRLGKVVASQL
jgi:alkaline phosphatase D